MTKIVIDANIVISAGLPWRGIEIVTAAAYVRRFP
jgi:hypothetical protein